MGLFILLKCPFREELKEACDNGDFIFELLYNRKGVYFLSTEMGLAMGRGAKNVPLM